MAKTAILSLILIVLLAAGVEAACVTPTDGMVITKSTTLCAGNYNLPNGIVVGNGDVTLNCNGAVLEGNLDNAGVFVKGRDGVVITRCVIRNYEYGIYFEDSFDNEVAESEITDCGVGVYMLQAKAEMIENMLLHNEEDYVNYTMPGEPEIVREVAEPVVEVVKPSEVDFANIVEESVVESLGVKEGYEKAKDIVVVSRKKVDLGDKIEYSIKVTPKWEVYGLEIYEYIPKALVRSASMIESSTPFEVIKDDPEIVFKLGKVEAGESEVVVYSISKPELSEINPFSVASIERAINPTDSWIIRLLFSTAIVLFLVNHFVKKEVSIKKGER